MQLYWWKKTDLEGNNVKLYIIWKLKLLKLGTPRMWEEIEYWMQAENVFNKFEAGCLIILQDLASQLPKNFVSNYPWWRFCDGIAIQATLNVVGAGSWLHLKASQPIPLSSMLGLIIVTQIILVCMSHCQWFFYNWKHSLHT